MYHPGSTQPNSTLAGLQRTFYPKYISYFGNGTGRDCHVIKNNGGMCKVDKEALGHAGVHLRQYNSTVTRRQMSSPRKEASTFYYQSDGSGRDTYVLKDNGGLRYEYNNKTFGDRIFRSTLRSDNKSPLPTFRPKDGSDIT